MDLAPIISKVSWTEKGMRYCLYVGSKKITHIYLQNRNRLKDIGNKLVVTKGEGQGGSMGLTDTNLYIYKQGSTV